ncbi:hypothetical protein AB833_20920 [Chromatiales bacterium (ex Bugula neritina AB1)]|nr:hypothetical protein AB833_20920 [Chromatiales bacterium (ex Bugula neritina AB1)]
MNQQSSLKNIRTSLQKNPDLPVVFVSGEARVSPGYHVSEIKFTTVQSLDCGSGSDQWDEIVVQLLDGNPKSSAGYMNAGKMQMIIEKSLQSYPVESTTVTYFEFAIGNNGLQKMAVNSIFVDNQQLKVELKGLQAQCKPFQRMLRNAKINSTKSENTSECCGSSADEGSKPTGIQPPLIPDVNSQSRCCR